MWPIWTYEDYIQKHTGAVESVDLLVPPDEPVDQARPNILMTYYNMADWMMFYDIPPDDHAFKIIVHRYRSEIKDYKSKLRLQFCPIPASATGQALLTELGRVNRTVRFIPNWDLSDPLDAFTQPRSVTNPDRPDWRNATARGKRVYADRRSPVGTGAGTNSVIEYTPAMWGPGGPRPAQMQGYDPDTIIFHELIHASRQMRGVAEDTQVNRGYGDVEDFLAVVIANIYISEKGKSFLFGDHQGGQLKQPQTFWNNGQKTNMTPRRLMLNFKGGQPDFYRDLVNVGPLGPPTDPRNWVWLFDRDLRAGKALAESIFGDG